MQKPAGLDEAVKPFVALRHAWSLADIPADMGRAPGIADNTPLRNAIPAPMVTVGDVRTLLRILESSFGEFTL